MFTFDMNGPSLLQTFLDAHGLTVADAADAFQCTRQAVYMWLSAGDAPRARRVPKAGMRRVIAIWTTVVGAEGELRTWVPEDSWLSSEEREAIARAKPFSKVMVEMERAAA